MTRASLLLVLAATTVLWPTVALAAPPGPPPAASGAESASAPAASELPSNAAQSAAPPSSVPPATAPAADVPGAPAPTTGEVTPATSGAAADSDESRSKTESDRRAHQRGRTWGYVSIAMGSIGALVAVGTSFAMLEQLRQRNRGCNNADKICTVDGLSANESLSQLAPWNVGSWIVTVGSFVAGAYLLAANPPDNRSKDSARLTGIGVESIGSGAVLSARGSF